MIDNQTLKIRSVLESELSAVISLELSSGLSTGGVGRFRNLLKDSNSLLLCAVKQDTVVDSQAIVGLFCGTVVLDEFQIDNLVVHEDYRQRGLGFALITSGLQQSAGLGAVTAILEVRTSNRSAQRLYEKCGFNVVGRRPDYYRDPQEDALTMTCQFDR